MSGCAGWKYRLDPIQRYSYTRILNDLMRDDNSIFEFCRAQHEISTSEKPIAGILGLESRIDGLLGLTDPMIAYTLDQRYEKWFAIGGGVTDYRWRWDPPLPEINRPYA